MEEEPNAQFREAKTKDEREERRRLRRRILLLFRCAHTYYSSKNIHRRDDARSLRVFLSGLLLRALSSLSLSLSLSLAHIVSYIEEPFWPSAAPFTLSLAPFVVASFPDRKRLANIFFNPLGVFGLVFVFK
mmetsp:Transcript_4135/g.12766  ORF Transcript_4135/g.12766 Transcript_4135/m.12766 type:complete len:131 (-) Transcript_4135:1633-2025(-)